MQWWGIFVAKAFICLYVPFQEYYCPVSICRDSVDVSVPAQVFADVHTTVNNHSDSDTLQQDLDTLQT